MTEQTNEAHNTLQQVENMSNLDLGHDLLGRLEQFLEVPATQQFIKRSSENPTDMQGKIAELTLQTTDGATTADRMKAKVALSLLTTLVSAASTILDNHSGGGNSIHH